MKDEKLIINLVHQMLEKSELDDSRDPELIGAQSWMTFHLEVLLKEIRRE